MIDQMRLLFPIATLCKVLEVSKSGYYARINRKPSARSLRQARMEVEILAAHKRNRKTYGAYRLQSDLADHGVALGVHQVKRIKRKLGLRCVQKKRFRATTDSSHGYPVADNILGQRFEATAPGQIWVSDITYIPTEEGWLYLAGHKDLFTKAIVGYAMGPRLTRELVKESLKRSVWIKGPNANLIHHSDRGTQYCSHDYRQMLNQFNMLISMSRKGNCYDNAPMESFWGILKTELTFHCKFKTRDEARKAITEYIEVFYNRQRKQKKLGYLSPAAFEKLYYQNLKAA